MDTVDGIVFQNAELSESAEPMEIIAPPDIPTTTTTAPSTPAATPHPPTLASHAPSDATFSSDTPSTTLSASNALLEALQSVLDPSLAADVATKLSTRPDVLEKVQSSAEDIRRAVARLHEALAEAAAAVGTDTAAAAAVPSDVLAAAVLDVPLVQRKRIIDNAEDEDVAGDETANSAIPASAVRRKRIIDNVEDEDELMRNAEDDTGELSDITMSKLSVLGKVAVKSPKHRHDSSESAMSTGRGRGRRKKSAVPSNALPASSSAFFPETSPPRDSEKSRPVRSRRPSRKIAEALAGDDFNEILGSTASPSRKGKKRSASELIKSPPPNGDASAVKDVSPQRHSRGRRSLPEPNVSDVDMEDVDDLIIKSEAAVDSDDNASERSLVIIDDAHSDSDEPRPRKRRRTAKKGKSANGSQDALAAVIEAAELTDDAEESNHDCADVDMETSPVAGEGVESPPNGESGADTAKPKKAKKKTEAGKFTKEESQKLCRLVEKYGTDWNLIGRLMGTGKKGHQLSQHYRRVARKDIYKGSWTLDEETRLNRYVSEYEAAGRPISWTEISRKMSGRTDIQCRYQYQKMAASRLEPFTDAEVVALVDVVMERAGLAPHRLPPKILSEYRRARAAVELSNRLPATHDAVATPAEQTAAPPANTATPPTTTATSVSTPATPTTTTTPPIAATSVSTQSTPPPPITTSALSTPAVPSAPLSGVAPNPPAAVGYVMPTLSPPVAASNDMLDTSLGQIRPVGWVKIARMMAKRKFTKKPRPSLDYRHKWFALAGIDPDSPNAAAVDPFPETDERRGPRKALEVAGKRQKLERLEQLMRAPPLSKRERDRRAAEAKEKLRLDAHDLDSLVGVVAEITGDSVKTKPESESSDDESIIEDFERTRKRLMWHANARARPRLPRLPPNQRIALLGPSNVIGVVASANRTPAVLRPPSTTVSPVTTVVSAATASTVSAGSTSTAAAAATATAVPKKEGAVPAVADLLFADKRKENNSAVKPIVLRGSNTTGSAALMSTQLATPTVLSCSQRAAVPLVSGTVQKVSEKIELPYSLPKLSAAPMKPVAVGAKPPQAVPISTTPKAGFVRIEPPKPAVAMPQPSNTNAPPVPAVPVKPVDTSSSSTANSTSPAAAAQPTGQGFLRVSTVSSSTKQAQPAVPRIVKPRVVQVIEFAGSTPTSPPANGAQPQPEPSSPVKDTEQASVDAKDK